ncbi:MAG: tetratricopeptide repeat protein [Deltaproteobacteria bacterium]|nr:tetratricopeptide repeat protein [Deltaproteobacteria bacterium]
MRRSYWWILSIVLASVTGALLAKGTAPPNLEKALRAQMELHQKQPTNPDIANDLGNLLVLAGLPQEAEAAYRTAVENSGDNPTPSYNLGLLLQQQGRSGDALKAFEAVLSQDSENAWAKYQIGSVYESLGDKSRAVKAYADAFVIDPDLASANVNPQVIESKLTVEAMLMGFRRAAQQPLAPKSYDDPRRIANLLISSSSVMSQRAESEDELGAEMEADESALENVSSRPSQQVADAEDSPPASGGSASSQEKETPRQVLTSDTIERGGSLGQVTSRGGSNRRGSARSTPSRGTSTRSTPSRGTSSRSRGSSPRGRSTGSANDAAARGFRTPTTGSSNTAGGRGRPGRVRYVPPGRSTSSLELDWNVPSAPLSVVPAG